MSDCSMTPVAETVLPLCEITSEFSTPVAGRRQIRQCRDGREIGDLSLCVFNSGLKFGRDTAGRGIIVAHHNSTQI